MPKLNETTLCRISGQSITAEGTPSTRPMFWKPARDGKWKITDLSTIVVTPDEKGMWTVELLPGAYNLTIWGKRSRCVVPNKPTATIEEVIEKAQTKQP